VGQRLDQAVTRAAVGAIGKGIAVTTVAGIEDFPHTIRARRYVRRHQRRPLAARRGGPDLEGLVTGGVQPGGFETLDETARRLFRLESKEEGFEALARSLDFQENSLAGIVDPARQAQPGRQAENKGAEADTLHRAANGHLQPRCWKSLH